eukprot:TRINITY_DN2719_c0_g2_i1.p1 TRINITY_DN2719_c0_g2~~TRINITY_DN2719_c0_g2_i1.p1  ORF type:complete len:181 (+),score=21.73 TRINITY_DN2719_c0_g2_i1:197-739(+)
MVAMRCTCLATSTWTALPLPDCASPVSLVNEQGAFAQPNSAPLVGRRQNWRRVPVNSFRFSEEFRADRSGVGFEYADEPWTNTGYRAAERDSIIGRPPYLRRNIVAGTIALAVCISTGRAESSQLSSSSSSPPSLVNGSPSSTTDSWYRYKGQGFVVKVPPDFEDLLESEVLAVVCCVET